MTINCYQLSEYIIKPMLKGIGLYSDAAHNLLIGTAAVETQLGKFIVQQVIGSKGAVSIYQIEKNAYDDIWERQIENSSAMKAKLRILLGYEGKPEFSRMISDMALATIMCRLYYYAVPINLPRANDIEGLASYWKTYYNTIEGEGTTQKFIDAYRKYIC